ELPYDKANFAVGQVGLVHSSKGVINDVVPPRIGDIDHFVAIQHPLCAQRLAGLALPIFVGLGPSTRLAAEGLLKPSIQAIHAGLAGPNRRKNLPCLNVGASSTTAFDAR